MIALKDAHAHTFHCSGNGTQRCAYAHIVTPINLRTPCCRWQRVHAFIKLIRFDKLVRIIVHASTRICFYQETTTKFGMIPNYLRHRGQIHYRQFIIGIRCLCFCIAWLSTESELLISCNIPLESQPRDHKCERKSGSPNRSYSIHNYIGLFVFLIHEQFIFQTKQTQRPSTMALNIMPSPYFFPNPYELYRGAAVAAAVAASNVPTSIGSAIATIRARDPSPALSTPSLPSTPRHRNHGDHSPGRHDGPQPAHSTPHLPQTSLSLTSSSQQHRNQHARNGQMQPAR